MRVRAALLLAAVTLALAVLFVGKISRKMPDLEVYWTAASRASHAEALYRPEDGHYQFKYLPAFAVLTIPLAAVSLDIAKAIWFVTSVALLGLLLALSLRLLPDRRRRVWVLIALTALVMLKFYGHELVLGQMNALFAVIVVVAILAARDGRETALGALVALAIVVKPYAVIFLPWLAARRQRASIIAVLAGGVIVALLPAVVYGLQSDIQLHRDWWLTVTTSTAPNLMNADNVSIAAMWTKWIGMGRPAAILAAATSAIALGSAAITFARRTSVPSPDPLEGAMLLTLIPLLSPQGWDYVFLVSTPAIMLLVNYDDMLPRIVRGLSWIALAVIALSVYDIMGRTAYSVFMSLSAITVCYFVVVAALYALRVRRAA
jgi:hypothetical protein